MKYIVYVFMALVMLGCKDVKSEETKQLEETAEQDKEIVSTVDQWTGVYYVEAFNRDEAKTSYDIDIKSIDDINVSINEDDSKESYSHVKGEVVEADKIKIVYNSASELDMGIIYIEKRDNEYLISGNPIYFINPGTEEITLTKVK